MEMASQILDADLALFTAGLLHRDLAARNVLVFSFDPADATKVNVKLTDFGLTIKTDGDPAWPKGHAMGTRWMAPEAQPTAEFEFGEASEVYAWGCLLYEIFARGRVPYAGVGNAAISSAKRRGGPMPGPRPANCPPAVYELMKLCWEFYPANRPSLQELRMLLDELQRSNGARLRPIAPDSATPWQPLMPERILALDEAALAPEVRKLGESEADWTSIVTHHSDEIVSFPLLSEEFCKNLLAELEAFHASGRTTERANSNNRHSLKVVELGWSGFLEPLVSRIATPMASALGLVQGGLTFRHAHTVQRVHPEDSSSPLPGSNRGSRHTDASSVTLNVNLGGTWTGGDLLFFGESAKPLRVEQRPGTAVMHRGNAVHQAALLESGYRINIVVWTDPSPESRSLKSDSSTLDRRSSVIRMNSGLQQPLLGLGVYQSPRGGVTKRTVQWAIESGYRHIDSATLYNNEDEVGKAVRESSVPRSKLFITSKLWTMDASCTTPSECEQFATRAVDASLRKSGLTYLDLYLIHSPHQPCIGGRLAFWRGLEAAVAQGKVLSIGVSNFGESHLKELLEPRPLHGVPHLIPAVNQIEIHPFLQHRDLAAFCQEHGIVVQAYSPLARAERFSGRSPTLTALAARLKRTEAQVLIRWSLQKGYVVLPKSVNRERIEENAGAFDFSLDEAAMAALDSLEEGLVTIWEPMVSVKA
jgi:diketogulonate reductase-like aldo/keto reductase